MSEKQKLDMDALKQVNGGCIQLDTMSEEWKILDEKTGQIKKRIPAKEPYDQVRAAMMAQKEFGLSGKILEVKKK